ncbi:MAG: hypothetical protein FRX48_01737 [Lasallia pustulata]|uniref:Uncharacterized protein n=1 Tax=Lasallia pustulata TaxID=136370 RepID=A0A5M8Q1X7_9LECA|nr:MAG: hypothetical protein FRX48_01737 [Lasallia pustulata]
MPSRTRGHYRAYSDSSSDSGCSDGGSDLSRSTAPTDYSGRPSLKQRHTTPPLHTNELWERDTYSASPVSYDHGFDLGASVETYASTVPSTDDYDDDEPRYQVPEYEEDVFPTTAISSTPADFADFFPSSRRLCIRHDDATIDGNMNLRVDTEIFLSKGRRADLTLFHLRMHDLKSREFSFRRYCRDSGREVCHSSRKYVKPASDRKPGIQRSMSNALSSLRTRTDSRVLAPKNLKRHDSGYESALDEEETMEFRRPPTRSHTNIPIPTNTTQLEFSNYAHIDVKRRGAKTAKRYEFEYWGTSYAWRRKSRRDGYSKETSYHLVDTATNVAVAHIVPAPLTPEEAREEDRKGGWVPPCSMWISDERLLTAQTDVADVIVATGLIALVDDCIKSRWHQKKSVQLKLPVPMKSPLKMNMEYVGPKRLIDEVFNRRGHTATRHPTPLRQIPNEAHMH